MLTYGGIYVSRSELQGVGGEKGEISRKLRLIQEKVAEIEASHSVEMEKLLVCISIFVEQ